MGTTTIRPWTAPESWSGRQRSSPSLDSVAEVVAALTAPPFPAKNIPTSGSPVGCVTADAPIAEHHSGSGVARLVGVEVNPADEGAFPAEYVWLLTWL